LRIVAEEVGGLAKGLASVSANVRLVVIEVGIADFLEEELIERRGLGRFHDGRRRHGDGDAHAGVGTAAGTVAVME